MVILLITVGRLHTHENALIMINSNLIPPIIKLTSCNLLAVAGVEEFTAHNHKY